MNHVWRRSGQSPRDSTAGARKGVELVKQSSLEGRKVHRVRHDRGNGEVAAASLWAGDRLAGSGNAD